MSDSAAPDPRPVSLVTILAIFGCFALFLVLVRFAYNSHPPAYIPENEVADMDVRLPGHRRSSVYGDRIFQAAPHHLWIHPKARTPAPCGRWSIRVVPDTDHISHPEQVPCR